MEFDLSKDSIQNTITNIPLLINKLRYFSQKRYSQLPKASFLELNLNLVSAMGIFVLGCGVTVYHGVHNLLAAEPHKPGGSEQLIILVISLLVVGYSLYVVIQEIKGQAKARSEKFFAYLNESMDPSISAIFWEDLATIVGLLLALIGIVLTDLMSNNTFDSVASIFDWTFDGLDCNLPRG